MPRPCGVGLNVRMRAQKTCIPVYISLVLTLLHARLQSYSKSQSIYKNDHPGNIRFLNTNRYHRPTYFAGSLTDEENFILLIIVLSIPFLQYKEKIEFTKVFLYGLMLRVTVLGEMPDIDHY